MEITTKNKIILKYLAFTACLLVLFSMPVNALVTWPTGAAPCNDINDIETCLNGVVNGETIEIAANSIPSQSGISVSPAKSFTLRAAAGFAPVFSGFTSLYFTGSDDDITVVIEGLSIEVGNFTAVQGGAGIFDVTFRNNTVEDSSFRSAIAIRSGNASPPFGPVIFLVEGNILNVEDEEASAISVGGFIGAGNEGQILNNRITATNTGQSAVISVSAGSSGMDVDVISNEIFGQNFNVGIGVRLFGTGGLLNAKLINNVIQGQEGNSGQPGAISLSNSSSGSGHSNFEVVNNTLAFNQRGISYGGREDLGATSNAMFMNNIIAFSSQSGFSIGGDFNATTINDYNLIFGNASNFYTPGINDVEEDPSFISNIDLRLQQFSPAIDAGLNSALPASVVYDINGNTRIQQIIVDLGAFEAKTDDLIFADGFE
ncbi:hypothetical protein MNBD_GAMMA01-131 [hydrothermal vent metagenome]|uniref:Right handed beta helix domain-containing protein n=1 Tax=hydrothermal vent metagenome TaxID=652676 RepID=A0A3B0VFW3_9ZZZZ